MKLCTLTLLIVVTADLARAGEGEAGSSAPPSEWRQAVLPSYHFTPRPAERSPVDSVRAPAAPEADSRDVIKMAPVVVHDSAISLKGLHEAVVRNEADANTAEKQAKFGIKVYEYRGKRVTFGALTIFFIPVAFGFKW